MMLGFIPAPVGAFLAAGAALGFLYLDRYDAPGPQPEGLASDGVNLWVADFQTARIYRMDPSTGAVLGSHPAPGPRPEGLAWDGTHLWCADWETRKIYRLAVSDTGFAVDRVLDPPTVEAFPPRPVGLAWDGSALWLTTWFPYWLWRIDPVTAAPLRTLDLRPANALYPVQFPRPEDLAWDGANLWITDWGTRAIYRVDPATLQVTRTIPSAAGYSVGLEFHGGRLWNGDTGESGVTAPGIYRMEETGGPTPVHPTTWGRLKHRFEGGAAPLTRVVAGKPVSD